MSAFPSPLGSRIENMLDQLDNPNMRQRQTPQPDQPRRPNILIGIPPICSRKKTLLPIETKLREIMSGNGILKIDGVQYQTAVAELQDLGTLGNGTCGHVVKMRHPTTDTTIAVKQMRRTGNIEENNRIIMDIDVVLKSHDCPYIVQCLGYFITECDVWVCMELMKTCFDKLLKRLTQPVPESIMGKITVATVRALSYLKEKHDVIHRDIKPSNILIDEHGNIKLCDFGISGRLVDSKAKTRSAGCAAYMAPERIDPNKSEYDIRADVWSLGITLIELATGSNPYKGCDTDFEVLTRVLQSDPPSLPKDCGFSVEFQMFVKKCLTKNHLKRPKYPELLEQPFILRYEREEVDVRGWFASVMQSPPQTDRPQCLPSTTTFHPSLLHRPHKPTTTTTTTATTRAPTTTTTTISSPSSIPCPTTSAAAVATEATASKPQPHTASATQPHQRSQIPNFLRPRTSGILTSHTTAASRSPKPSSSATTTPPKSPCSPLVSPATPTGDTTAAPPPPRIAPTPTLSTSSTQLASSPTASTTTVETHTSTAPTSPVCADTPPAPVLLPRMRNYDPVPVLPLSSAAHQTQMPHARHPSMQQQQQQQRTSATTADAADGGSIVGQMNQLYRRSPFMQRRSAGGGAEASTAQVEAIYSNLAQSPFAQRKLMLQQNPSHPSAEFGPPPHHHPHHQQLPPQPHHNQQQQQHHHHQHHQQQQQQLYGLNGGRIAASASPSLINRKRFQTTVPIVEPMDDVVAADVRPKGNTSPIVLQRFYHQQNQLRDRQERRQRASSSGATATTAAPTENTNPFLSQIPKFRPDYSPAPIASQASHIPHYRYVDQRSPLALAAAAASANGSPKHQFYFGAAGGSSNHTSPLQMRRMQQPQPQPPQHGDMDGIDYGASLQRPEAECVVDTRPKAIGRPAKTNGKAGNLASEAGADPEDPGVVKRRFASYVKLHLANGGRTGASTSGTAAQNIAADRHQRTNDRTDQRLPHYRSASASAAPAVADAAAYHHHNQALDDAAATTTMTQAYGKCHPPSPHVLRNNAVSGLHHHQQQRHRSPDPPPRYNRGQSPLVLRRNLQELAGGSPLFNRRYTSSASPPQPPPRRGSESVPGSPHNFRTTTRIHYTPEPQRHAYRTVTDQ